jgi:hypothetical protein
VFLGAMTLGVAPVMAWIHERNWPSLVDEQGLVTRGGTRIAWNEFTRVTKIFTKVGSTRTEHFELASPKGKVVVAAYRLVNGEHILNYIWQRLPERAKQVQA